MTDERITIADSTVWIDYFDDLDTLQTIWLDQNLGRGRIGLTDLIFLEVLQGFRDDGDFLKAKQGLLSLAILQSGGQEIAIESAANYRKLRKRGITIRKTIDCVIATYCIAHGHRLLHNDRDFDHFEKHLGLQVIHPQTH